MVMARRAKVAIKCQGGIDRFQQFVQSHHQHDLEQEYQPIDGQRTAQQTLRSGGVGGRGGRIARDEDVGGDDDHAEGCYQRDDQCQDGYRFCDLIECFHLITP